jgi:hypothetical protein
LCIAQVNGYWLYGDRHLASISDQQGSDWMMVHDDVGRIIPNFLDWPARFVLEGSYILMKICIYCKGVTHGY